MVGVLADQYVGEQSGSRSAAFDGPRRQRRLGEAVAACAGEARTCDPVHDEPSRDVLELLGHILADLPKPATASGAVICLGQKMDHRARHVIGNGSALGLALLLGGLRQAQLRRHGGRGQLARLERQLQLIGRLGRSSKPVRTVPGKLVAQLLDQDRLRLHLRDQALREGAQIIGIVREGGGLVEHEEDGNGQRSLWESSIPCAAAAMCAAGSASLASGVTVHWTVP